MCGSSKVIMYRFLALFVALGFTVASFGKPAPLVPSPQVETLNAYVEFINKSIHGMFMVNRLLVEYNMELNKYVDLENEKINNYSNKDLPKDIFEDPDHWFYEVSPYILIQKAKAGSSVLSPEEKGALSALADKMLTIIKTSNQLRFDMDKVTYGADLTKKDNVSRVYKKLEEGVKLFDDFYLVQTEMEKVIETCREKYGVQQGTFGLLYGDMVKLQKSSRAILARIRAKETENIDQLITQHKSTVAALKSKKTDGIVDSKSKQAAFLNHLQSAASAAEKLNTSTVLFMQNENVPSKYKLYGRFYYYYNVELLDKNNYYGTGLVSELNNAIQVSGLPALKLTEMPHIFQIIYPKKIDNAEIIKATDNMVSLPTKVKERVVNKNKIIRVDAPVVEFQLYDHMIADGDIVSINFNGDWILEKEELEKGSKTVKLQLNKEGKNFLLLHADNVGKRPPNTMAISYKYRGEKKQIILKSDNNTSELIEIILVDKL
ncbi:MAG: hypothetical protein IPN29_16915 [Saprospiraceae bacterium]|nr:hypothetical protein [Saprospiraceae bacterium]